MWVSQSSAQPAINILPTFHWNWIWLDSCVVPQFFLRLKVFNLQVQLKTAKTEQEFSLSSSELEMMNVVVILSEDNL